MITKNHGKLEIFSRSIGIFQMHTLRWANKKYRQDLRTVVPTYTVLFRGEIMPKTTREKKQKILKMTQQLGKIFPGSWENSVEHRKFIWMPYITNDDPILLKFRKLTCYLENIFTVLLRILILLIGGWLIIDYRFNQNKPSRV